MGAAVLSHGTAGQAFRGPVTLPQNRVEGIDRVAAEILHQNGAMQRVCQKLGFALRSTPEVVEAWVDLSAGA